MEMWLWLGAYLVGFALLQLYLYRYFINGRSTTGDSSAKETTHGLSDGTGGSVDPPDDVSDDEVVCCETCGTYNRNEPMFTYCKECGTQLD